MRDFQENEFVIFDLETTGLSPRAGDKMIEIAALKVRGLKPVDRFHSLVQPQREISYGAFAVNGISREMLEGAPIAGEILPAFLEFAEGSCLVAHNAKFDLGFLLHELGQANLKMDQSIRILDTVRMARALLPEAGKHSLLSLAYFFDVGSQQSHRAMDDVELTFKVFLKLLECANRRDICDLDTLITLFGQENPEHPEKRHAAKLMLIKAAMDEARSLEIVYASPYSCEITNRQVTPKRVKGSGRNKSLVGFCHLRGSERTFLIDRIVRLQSKPAPDGERE